MWVVGGLHANDLLEYKFEKKITLNGFSYNDIWVCREDGTGIYYSKRMGIIAIEIRDRVYLRI